MLDMSEIEFHWPSIINDKTNGPLLSLYLLAITALCMQYAAVVMSTPAQPSTKASWNDQEVTALIAYLYEH